MTTSNTAAVAWFIWTLLPFVAHTLTKSMKWIVSAPTTPLSLLIDLLTWSQTEQRRSSVMWYIYGNQVSCLLFTKFEIQVLVLWNHVCVFENLIQLRFCGVQFCFKKIKFSFCWIQVSNFWEFKFAFCGIQVCVRRINQVFVLWNSSLGFVEFKFAWKESSLRFRRISLRRKNQVCLSKESSCIEWTKFL